MSIYDPQIATAKKLINAKGGDCVYYSRVTVPGDVDEPWRRSGRDDLEYPIKAVVLPGAVSGRGIPGTDHQGEPQGPVGTHKAYIAGADLPTDFQVQTDDRLLDASGQNWQVIKGWKLGPDGPSIMFTLELRA